MSYPTNVKYSDDLKKEIYSYWRKTGAKYTDLAKLYGVKWWVIKDSINWGLKRRKNLKKQIEKESLSL